MYNFINICFTENVELVPGRMKVDASLKTGKTTKSKKTAKGMGVAKERSIGKQKGKIFKLPVFTYMMSYLKPAM